MPAKKRIKQANMENVTFVLSGDDAEEFRRFKSEEIIDTNAIAGKKLAIERLRQWRAQQAQRASQSENQQTAAA